MLKYCTNINRRFIRRSAVRKNLSFCINTHIRTLSKEIFHEMRYRVNIGLVEKYKISIPILCRLFIADCLIYIYIYIYIFAIHDTSGIGSTSQTMDKVKSNKH
jgi:hypothetical protein